jgi:protein SCO1/2
VRRFFLSLAVIVLFPACRKAPEPLPKYWQIPPFTLTERSGQPFDSAALKGKVWVADFFFASCPGVCPILTARMSALHQKFAGEDGVRFVSITTDPASDTPSALQEYAAKFHADQRWLFLTGDKAAIWKLCLEGFKLSVVDSPGGPESITHSTRLLLIDKTGTVRGNYDGAGEERPEQIVADIRRLLKE